MPHDNSAPTSSLTAAVTSAARFLWNSTGGKLRGVFPITTDRGSEAQYHALVVAADHEHQSLQEDVELSGTMGLQFQEQFEKSKEVREGDAVAQFAAAVSSSYRFVRLFTFSLKIKYVWRVPFQIAVAVCTHSKNHTRNIQH